MTVSELLTIISTDLLSDPSNGIWSQSNLIRLINRSYETLQGDLKGFLSFSQNSSTISLVAGTQEYSTPSDFLTVNQITRDGIELTKIDKNDVDDAEGEPSCYYIYEGYIGFYPLPVQAESLTLYYECSLATLTSSSTLLTPRYFDYAIANLAASHAYRQKGSFDSAAVCEGEYYKELNRGKMLTLQDSNIDYHPRTQGT